MSNAPHLVYARAGIKFGAAEMLDHMQYDGLVDAFDKHAMGMCAENTASKMNFTREQQDAYALESFARTARAYEAGKFKNELEPVTVKSKKGDTVVDEDEGFRKVVPSKVATLPPAFKKGGSVTAANSSTINDGASALVLASAEYAQSIGAKPLARIIGIGDAAMAPIDFPLAPAASIPKALKMAGLSIKDIDYWEINEAFAVVVLANMKILGISHGKLLFPPCCFVFWRSHILLDRTNVNGGAVSMGHPIGSSGSRIIVSLINILQQNKARYGCASICNGGGGASAVVIENLQ